jgi:hypothetical protein
MFMCEQLEDRRLMTVSPGTGMELDRYLDAINSVLIQIPNKVTHGRLHEALQEYGNLEPKGLGPARE